MNMKEVIEIIGELPTRAKFGDHTVKLSVIDYFGGRKVASYVETDADGIFVATHSHGIGNTEIEAKENLKYNIMTRR